MKVSSKKLPKSEMELVIEVLPDSMKKYRGLVIKELGNQIKVDGFRKGHIPEKVLVERLGEPAILSEVVEVAVRESFIKAVDKEKIHVLSAPKVSIDKHDPLVFTATVAVMPDIKIPELDKITVPKKKEIKVDKKEVEDTKKQLCERFMEIKKADRKAKEGDMIEIDFEGFDDGVSLEGTMSKHHPIVIGSKTFIPGFEEELVGLKAGDEKEFDITFPKDYAKKNFQNRKVKFKVKVHDVFDRIIPEFDEKLAEKALGQKKSAKELEKEIEDSLKIRHEREDRIRMENDFLENLSKKATVELPEVLIDQELDAMVGSMKDEIARARLTWEKHLENLKTTEEDLRKKIKPGAENRVKTRLAFTKLLEAEKINVDNKEVEVEISKAMLRVPPQQAEDAKKHFAKGEAGWNEVAQQLIIDKFFKKVLG